MTGIRIESSSDIRIVFTATVPPLSMTTQRGIAVYRMIAITSIIYVTDESSMSTHTAGR